MQYNELTRTKIARHLPTHVRWVVAGNHLDFDFSRSKAPLRTIAPADLIGSIEDEWKVLFLFGQRCYDGGASPFLGVHRDSGGIFGLDVELDRSHVFLLNSDVDRFIRSFQLVDQALRSGPINPHSLSQALLEIDPDAFPRSDWQNLSRHLDLG